MDAPFLPEIVIQNLGPEVKSFIYQAILEFEPYSTPETVVTVTSKNPLELITRDDIDLEGLPQKSKLKKMYRIEISLSESGSTISAEGLDIDIYEAIKTAKDLLLKILGEIQDDVVSNQDRQNQIRHALAAGESVH